MLDKLKDKIALWLSILAFALSSYATVAGERRAFDEKKRTIRSQLTDVLGKLSSLQVENARLMHDAKDDSLYQQAVNQALSQQNGFLLDQAFYLADQIPNLVTTYEFNTIAGASFNAGNVLATEKYHLKAIEAAHSELYKTQATRSYAAFLFSQKRLIEGREQFNKALSLLKDGGNLTRQTNGISYQMWAWNEKHLALAEQDAKILYDKARVEFSGIDVEFLRDSLLQKLDAEQNYFSSVQSITPNRKRHVPELAR
ncbi:MAG: hypothetical protein AAB242_10500 [Nitrospirota bacterium]